MKSSITQRPDGSFLALNVRVAYPDLYEAKPFKNDPKNTPRFGVNLLLPKTDEASHKVVDDAIKKLAKDKLSLAKIPAADTFLKDGDESNNEAFHGHWVLSLYRYPDDSKPNKGAPDVRARDKSVKLTRESEPNIFSGSYANVVFDAYVQPKWKKVNGGLNVVQLVGDGPPIGRGADISDLPDLPDEISDEDL